MSGFTIEDLCHRGIFGIATLSSNCVAEILRYDCVAEILRYESSVPLNDRYATRTDKIEVVYLSVFEIAHCAADEEHVATSEDLQCSENFQIQAPILQARPPISQGKLLAAP